MKKFWIQSLAAVAALALASGAFAADLAKFDSKPGSKVKLDGTSSIHAWSVESGIVAGAMELDSAFVAAPTAAKPGKIDAKVQTTITVRSLKSSSGKLMDDRLYEAMKMQKFPKIEYRLTELTLKETPKAANGPFNFDSKGDLSFAGVTNKVSFPVTMTRTGNTIKTTGSTSVKMTSFGITPPGLVVAIKTGDDVTITFDWVTAPSETK